MRNASNQCDKLGSVLESHAYSSVEFGTNRLINELRA